MINLNRQSIPTNPGVYFFQKVRENLYVGKAGNLRNRLSQYLSANSTSQNGANQAFKPNPQLSLAKQRMINEATNIKWETTSTDIEALILESHYIKKYRPPYNILLRDDKTYLSVKITDEDFPRLLATRKIEKDGIYFGPFTDARAVKETLRTLRKYFPYRTRCKPKSRRLCLDAHMGLCPGVCADKITKTEYNKNIRRIKMFFEGKRGKVINLLKRELRLETKKGRLHPKDIKTNANIQQGRESEFTKADKLRTQINYLEKVLTMQHVLHFSDKVEGDIIELGKVLGLKKPPQRIEGYDISNIYGTLTVASMVVFMNGEADKSEYKKFKIKTVRGANDFASMQEVLRRRFAHQDWQIPNLVIVDGGRPQLSAAMKVWREYNLKIPLISLAKRHEEIFTTKSHHPLVLPRTSGALHLIQRVRDEAHRFAVNYHKLLRRRKLTRK